LTVRAGWGTSGGPSADLCTARPHCPASWNDADLEKEFLVVKKSIACVAAVLAIAGGYGVWGSWVNAQGPTGNTGVRPVSATGPAPTTPVAGSTMPGTRVAVVNINKVLKNYGKAKKLNDELRDKFQKFAKQANEKKEEMQKLQTELAQPQTLQPRKEQLEKQIVNLQRTLQDLDNDARKTLGKEQGDIAVQIFREIEGVIRAVATSNNFDIVLSYPDATEDSEMYVQDAVVRKLTTPGAMPLFYKPHCDMTKAVIDTLNMSYPVTATAPTAPTTPRP
jgi:Skp family chaperone for outer membrane proteins